MAAIKKPRGFAVFLFVSYLLLLFYFLFFSEGFGRTQLREDYQYNLTPLHEIMRFIQYRHILGFRAFIINIFGNVIAFMPLGFFLPQISKKKINGFQIVFSCFLVSLLVETLQLVSKLGSFDVDDLLLNTLGGLLGYIVYLIFHKLAKRKTKRKG